MGERRYVELPEWDLEADVVVVGYGGAGATVAITAHDEGARVLVLEKQPPDELDADGSIVRVRHHPNSRMSGALHFTATSVDDLYAYQKAMNALYGVDDVPDDMLRVWAEEVVANTEWIRAMKGSERFYTIPTGQLAATSAALRPEFTELPGAGSTLHLHNNQAGWGWFDFLSGNVRERGIEVRYGTRVRELVQDPATKEVLGVTAERDGEPIAVKARRAVVLTTGGFEFDMELQASYLRVWPFRFYGNPHNTGDGIRMAQKAGAALWHMNNVSARVTGWWPDSTFAFTIMPWLRGSAGAFRKRDGTSFPSYESSHSFVIVDRRGKRFAKEIYRIHTFYWEVVKFDTERQEFPRIPCHMIFDEKTRRAGPIAILASGASGPAQLYEWSEDNSAEIERGWIRKGDTIGELAQRIGVPADNLEATVARWNESCRKHWDADFGRPAFSLEPLDTPPFYECIQWPGGPNTQGGPKRNKHAQVLDPDDRPIPRLYSSGELGSIYGSFYEGGGNTAECMAFGRIAGRNAAGERPWDSP